MLQRRVLFAVVSLCCLLAWQFCSAAPARTPNIILILIDDMGAADAGCFGSTYYKTPEIDRLAQAGNRFTQAYASCAVCSPTRAAIMTGKASARLHITDWIPGEGNPKESRFRVPDWQQSLLPSEITLAESLKRFGYATAAIGKWHLGPPDCSPEKQGFDVSVAAGAIGHPASYFWPYGEQGASHRVPGLAERGGSKGEYLTDRLTDASLEFIEANRDRPFFLYLAHYAVHSPLMAKQTFLDEASQSTPSKGQSNAVYFGMMRSVDESVGRILRCVENSGLNTNTIVIFTSDNGGAVHFGKPPATSNRPLRLGKGYAYEGGLRVPLVVCAPGVTRPGSVCDVPVISHDLFPTLMELAVGEKVSPTALDGRSFVGLLRGEPQASPRPLFWHYPHYWNGKGVTPYSVIRDGDWKLIRFYETGRDELYNLRTDPGEQKNLSPEEPGRNRQLSSKLEMWLKDVGAQMPVPRTSTK